MAGKRRGANIIVLLLDTMRSSALAGAGLTNIKRLAKKGVVYANTVAPGTWTAPSHAALFTDIPVSGIPSVSKDFFTGGTRSIDPWMVKTRFLNDGADTLAKRLSSLGYQTSLFSNNPFLSSFTNLGSGFERIEDLWLDSNLKYNTGLVQRLGGIINGGPRAREAMFKTSYYATRLLPPAALDWLYLRLRQRLNEGICDADGTHRLDRGAKDTEASVKRHLELKYDYRPQFMFMNYIEAHENYPVGPRSGIAHDKWIYLSGIREIDSKTRSEFYRGYMKRLRYLDGRVGRMLEMMRSKGILDNATVVITSDHGQLFGEHGLLFHAVKPYEGVAKIPLIAANFVDGKISGEPERIERPVSLRALNRALLNLADGTSTYLNGDLRSSRYVLSEHTGIAEGWDAEFLRMLKPRSKSATAIYEAKNRCNRKAVAVYKGGMKLIHNIGGDSELYDISRDPDEQDNLIHSRREVALELSRQIPN
ncbi:MAG: sulfatase-like hydrolase/transferase [Candidatus Micrarchaeota archaeon]|nr:sulfatase-like hydrolase/transferase [Candidatus Micrarchaeota archaeon]